MIKIIYPSAEMREANEHTYLIALLMIDRTIHWESMVVKWRPALQISQKSCIDKL